MLVTTLVMILAQWGQATAAPLSKEIHEQDSGDENAEQKSPEEQAKDLVIDLQVPGEEKPPEGKVNDEHPWTVVEKLPVLTDPRGAVGVYHRDSPRSLMWSFGRALDAYRELLQEERHLRETALPISEPLQEQGLRSAGHLAPSACQGPLGVLSGDAGIPIPTGHGAQL